MAASRDLANLGDAFNGVSNVNIDNNTLFVDAVNNKVGVGIVPNYNFHVQMPSNGAYGAVMRYIGGTNNPGLFFTTNESTRVSQIDASSSTSGILALATSGTERMRIDESGRVTMPYQPSFFAYGGSTQTGSGVVEYTAALTNVGSAYSNSTYRFTAPVNGTYCFNAYFLKLNTNSDTAAYFRKNGVAQAQPANHTGTNYSTCNITAILNLSVNDYVDVFFTGAVYAGYRVFGGYLIG